MTLCLLFGWQAAMAQGSNQHHVAPYNPQLMKYRISHDVMSADPNGPANMVDASTQSTNKTGALGTENIGRASNLYSIIRTSQANQVVTAEEENFIAFIHRQDIQKHGGVPTTTSNGLYRIDYSTDGGGSFTTDIGPMVPIAEHVNLGARARYPQMALYRPSGATSIDDYRIVFAGPTTGGNGWGNYVFGCVSNLSQVGENGSDVASPNITYDFLSNGQNRQVLIPNDLCMGEDGEFWMTDVEYDVANEELLDEIILWKGTLVGANDDSVSWEEYQRIDLNGVVSDCDGQWRHSNHNLAFSPDGQYGWLVFNGDWVEDGTQHYSQEPIFYKTEDGGDTWTGPIHMDLRQYSQIVDALATTFVDDNGNPVDESTQIPGASVGDLSVDNDGNPHYFVRMFNRADIAKPQNECDSALTFIQAGAAKPLFDITSTDRGETFCPKLITFNNTFQGSIDGTDVGFNNALQIGRTTDGTKMFYHWIDDTASTDATVMSPDLWTAGLDVTNDALIPEKLWSDDDPNYSGSVLFPQAAAIVGSDMTVMVDPDATPPVTRDVDYKLPIVFAELIGGDDLSTTQFIFAGDIEHSNNEFVSPTEDFAVTGITSPAANATLCGNSTVDVDISIENVGTTTLDTVDVRLLVTGPIQTSLVEDELVVNLAPGATDTYTFSGVDVSANGTYVISAFTQFDGLCDNNQEQITVVNVGGQGGDIFVDGSIDGCGELVLDAGLQNVPTSWSYPGGTPPNGQTLTLQAGDIAVGDDVTVTVTPGGGCAPITDDITVNLYELPAIDATDESVCADAGTLDIDAQNTAGANNTYAWTPGGATTNTLSLNLTNTNSGLYTVTVETPEGCVSTKEVDVKIWDVEANLAPNNETDICGDAFLDASNETTYDGTEYDWEINGSAVPSLEDLSAIPVERGENDYTVTITDPLGCKAGVTESITITKSDSIEAQLIAPNLSANDSGIYDFFADTTTRFPAGGDALTPYDGLFWEFTDPDELASAFPIYDPAGSEDLSGTIGEVTGSDYLTLGWQSTGGKTVRLTVSSGACSEIYRVDPTVLVPASRFDNIDALSSLQVFPNPSEGLFNVELNAQERKQFDFVVFDISGREIIRRSENVQGEYTTRFDLSGQAAGVYLLKIATEDGVSTTRLVKQ